MRENIRGTIILDGQSLRIGHKKQNEPATRIFFHARPTEKGPESGECQGAIHVLRAQDFEDVVISEEYWRRFFAAKKQTKGPAIRLLLYQEKERNSHPYKVFKMVSIEAGYSTYEIEVEEYLKCVDMLDKTVSDCKEITQNMREHLIGILKDSPQVTFNLEKDVYTPQNVYFDSGTEEAENVRTVFSDQGTKVSDQVVALLADFLKAMALPIELAKEDELEPDQDHTEERDKLVDKWSGTTENLRMDLGLPVYQGHLEKSGQSGEAGR